MKMYLQVLIGAFALLLLTGCGAKGPKFVGIEKPQKNQGLVYIYRPSSLMGAAVSYDMHAKKSATNDQFIGNLSNGAYIKYITEPNEIEFWGKTESRSSVTLDIEANKMYCIKGEVGIGFFIGRPHLTIVDNKLCLKEIKSTNLSSE